MEESLIWIGKVKSWIDGGFILDVVYGSGLFFGICAWAVL